MEKDRKRYGGYQFHMETAKKVHEPLKKGEKDYDYGFCRNDWGVLRMDDTDMKLRIQGLLRQMPSNHQFQI